MTSYAEMLHTYNQIIDEIEEIEVRESLDRNLNILDFIERITEATIREISLEESRPNPGNKEKVNYFTIDEVTQSKECSICLCNFESSDRVGKLPCRHMYHEDCLNKWIDKHNTCPVCRLEL